MSARISSSVSSGSGSDLRSKVIELYTNVGATGRSPYAEWILDVLDSRILRVFRPFGRVHLVVSPNPGQVHYVSEVPACQHVDPGQGRRSDMQGIARPCALVSLRVSRRDDLLACPASICVSAQPMLPAWGRNTAWN